ncbi:unnamed protein product [Calypogeia fissa]
MMMRKTVYIKLIEVLLRIILLCMVLDPHSSIRLQFSPVRASSSNESGDNSKSANNDDFEVSEYQQSQDNLSEEREVTHDKEKEKKRKRSKDDKKGKESTRKKKKKN